MLRKRLWDVVRGTFGHTTRVDESKEPLPYKWTGGFSAHAGQPFLLEYALASRRSLKHIFLVHGEERAAKPLMEKMTAAGLKRVSFPALHKKVEIGAEKS